MKVLQVIDQAFRTVVEEQDDTILWLTQSMSGAGAEQAVLLSGHGAYYAVQTRRQVPVSIGSWQQQEAADIRQDLARLAEKGVAVYVIDEDLSQRGISDLTVCPGVEVIKRTDLVALYENFDQVWHW